MIILDTDAFTYLYYARGKLRTRIEQFLQEYPNESICITSITWFEVIKGRFENLLKAEDATALILAQERLEATQDVLGGFAVLPINQECVDNFELLRKQKKRKMRRPDLLIASITLAYDGLLITGNIKDFRGVANLRVEDWIH